MNTRLLALLCCPDCRHAELELTVFQARDGEVLEGALACRRCASRLPVINGIPRLLPAALRAQLPAFHGDFFARHPGLQPAGAQRARAEVVRTLTGYSYQYTRLADHDGEVDRWRENFLGSITAGPEFFPGRLGLDAGCGSGRHLYWANAFGAEMVGVDLSEGVELARRTLAGRPGCHLVQADLHHLPFRDGVFDFAYSIGVLHHLPDPRDGFRHVAPAVRRGGHVFVWVYALARMRWWYRLSHLTWLRPVAPRLPLRAQYALSAGLAGLLEVTLWTPSRLVSALPGGGALAARIPLADSSRRTFTAKVRSVFDRIQPPVSHYHTDREVADWFRAEGFGDVTVVDRQGRGWIASGVKR